MMKKAIVLVNTGTPDSPSVSDVRRFLREFLSDPMVIDLPWLIRMILVNLIIVPFRASRSAKKYRLLWNEQGSPLRTVMETVVMRLGERLGDGFQVMGAMRYGNPSLDMVMEEVKKGQFSSVLIIPLFPQYASSTTGSVKRYVEKITKEGEGLPEIRFIEQFYSNPAFSDAFADRISSYDPSGYYHILFSYHSLPLSHIKKVHPGHEEQSCICTSSMPAHGTYCYKACCYETTRILAARLNLPEGSYSTAFQSGMSGKWLGPFTAGLLEKLAVSGKKKVLITAPSFVADCLETIVEIEDEYKNLFKEKGGKELVMVSSLNEDEEWLYNLIINLF
ncbi:MAG: ferrochelatase [Bacteroidales bacterium]|jgi:ferrochelatase|nr:ferrochelatase [Bacteroidales bacterium]